MIRVTVQGINTSTASAHHYLIAGQPVVVQHRVEALEAFLKGAASPQFAALLGNHREIKLLSATNSELRFHDLTPMASRAHRLRYWRRGRRGQIDIDGAPACCIDFKDSHIHIVNGQDMNSQLNLELVLGPALIVLLAYQKIYCLHAGVVQTPVGNIAFIAESGAGKSTLSQNQDDEWKQLSDDIAPVRDVKNAKLIELLPDFPQLKLVNARAADAPKHAVSLDHLIRINPEPVAPSSTTESIRIRKMQPVESLLQVVRHTVSAKLFSSPIMHKHASFARRVSMAVPMSEVSYPRTWETLPELRQRIVDHCRAEH